MHIRFGYEIDIVCQQAVPALLLLEVHPDRRHDISQPGALQATSLVSGTEQPSEAYVDSFGNICHRIVIPAGGARLAAEGVIYDSGFPDAVAPNAGAVTPERLPADTLVHLLGSRYCETDRLMPLAWELFGHLPPGWAQVQAICDFVHAHLRFNYMAARHTRTAAEAYEERTGVCRDFAHLSIAFCRCLNIPARYCTGYLGDIGVAADPNPMDFSAWFEAFLEGGWFAFDARHNRPRIGRILVARGRDAMDVPIVHSFGAHWLDRFVVVTEEIQGMRFPQAARIRREHWDTMAALRASE